MARRKKERKEEEASEAWLLPYSDMLTLLLGLFIVVSAMSNVDSNKFNALKNEFSQVMVKQPQRARAHHPPRPKSRPRQASSTFKTVSANSRRVFKNGSS